MAQQAVEKVGSDQHNFARTGRMALYGGCMWIIYRTQGHQLGGKEHC